jgi:hypothetical protein
VASKRFWEDGQRRLPRGRARGGNRPLEAFVAVADLMGFEHGCDVFP